MKARGMTATQIAARLDIAVQTVYQYLASQRQSVRGRSAKAGQTKWRCEFCNVPTVAGKLRCHKCFQAQRRVERVEMWQHRSAVLHEFRLDNGRVPTIRETARLLGVKQSNAHSIIKRVFGTRRERR